MIDREAFGWDIYCDEQGCKKTIYVDSPEHHWSDVVQALKEDGWKSENVRGEWLHTCDIHSRRKRFSLEDAVE